MYQRKGERCRKCGVELTKCNSTQDSDLCELCKIARERKNTIAIWVEAYRKGYCLVGAKIVKVRVELEDPRPPKDDDFDTALRWLAENDYVPLSQSIIDTSRGQTRVRQLYVYQKETNE